MRRLLILYHSQGGRTAALAEAVLRGARRATETETVMKRAGEATLADLLDCHGLIVGTPENFGYMAGMVKDFFDRTYYPAEGKTVGLPYALFVSAGNDGTGAVTQIDRIATGYGWKRVAEPLIARQEVTDANLAACEELGEAMASGVALGIF
ncbi:MAG: NAD(P)H-dependent oxidoreductase [Burkholderiales bacterium]|nr:NAD(P)H-dependent oxidoreductase [Burkholderiales bacterium]